LGTIWNKWLKSSLFDEFSRVDVIKGQKSKGRVMTAVALRRAAINEILRLCPVGAWIDVDDISRFMQATGHTFDVTHNPWTLYISDPQYGSLSHDGYHSWEILQFHFLLCFLFEYAAAVGIIDVAYTEPTEARNDFGDLWGTDDLEFLSRYDGLIYFRVTPLGAWCLGSVEDYTPLGQADAGHRRVAPVGGILSNRTGAACQLTKERSATWRYAMRPGTLSSLFHRSGTSGAIGYLLSALANR
jgi:hypothetical protein